MIDDILIFDDILSIEEQDFLLDFSNKNKELFEFLPNTIGNGIVENLKPYPGKVYMVKDVEKIITKNKTLFEIIHTLEINICKKIKMEFLQNSIQKINWLEPLRREYNKLELIHWDTIQQHYVIIYYINDSDGDTCIYTNKNGNNATQFMKTFSKDGLDLNNFELIQSITPKKGRAVIFNGKYPHCASYPTNNDRFVININFMAKEPKKNKSFI